MLGTRPPPGREVLSLKYRAAYRWGGSGFATISMGTVSSKPPSPSPLHPHPPPPPSTPKMLFYKFQHPVYFTHFSYIWAYLLRLLSSQIMCHLEQITELPYFYSNVFYFIFYLFIINIIIISFLFFLFFSGKQPYLQKPRTENKRY